MTLPVNIESLIDNGTQDVPQDVPQGVTQGDTQDDTQDDTQGKRHILTLPYIKYVGSGCSGALGNNR